MSCEQRVENPNHVACVMSPNEDKCSHRIKYQKRHPVRQMNWNKLRLGVSGRLNHERGINVLT